MIAFVHLADRAIYASTTGFSPSRAWHGCAAGRLRPAGHLTSSSAAVLLERDEDLWEQIDALGGLPAAIRGNPVARRLFSRILEADVKASAGYRPACPEPIACPVTAVRGVDDDLIDAGLLDGWSALNARKFDAVTLPGGHSSSTETITSINDAEYMTFPRLPAVAELGWSPKSTHDWPSFSRRLAAQAGFWTNAGINYYPSPRIAWPTEPASFAR
jgi:hypothetical protein